MNGFEVTTTARIKEFGEVISLLYQDANYAYEKYERSKAASNTAESDTYKRIFIRLVFSYLEGVILAMKQILIEDIEKSPGLNYSFAEIAAIREETFDVSKPTEVKTKFAPINNTEDNIKFAFHMLSKHWGLAHTLNNNDAIWQKLRNLKKVRNRLTHPRTTQDLQVGDGDVIAALDALSWLSGRLYELIDLATAKRQSLS